MTTTTAMGPNFKKLFIHHWSNLTVDRANKTPMGLAAHGDFVDQLGLAVNVAARIAETGGESLKGDAKDALDWVNSALTIVRQAGGNNPWATASDEDICGEILRRIEIRRSAVKA